MSEIRIVVFTDARGWHEKHLESAFLGVGANLHFVSLSQCRFTDHTDFGGLTIPGLKNALPQGVFVRSISAGTFEQVTLRLGFLHALAAMSVPVMNSASVIERTVDKSMTSHLLQKEQVATVPSWTCESRESATQQLEMLLSEGKKVVLKPLFGSRGRGLRLIESTDHLPGPEEVNHVYYLQEYIPSKDRYWRDWRVMVVDGKAICAMERRSDQWITNRAQGAQCLPTKLDFEPQQLAERAADAVGADYAGVDLICTKEGKWLVLEVNGVPAWQGLQAVSEVNIAGQFADKMVKMTFLGNFST